ncbi:MAG: hypothetical protein WHX60_12020, partial [Armatimonadota bacterium]
MKLFKLPGWTVATTLLLMCCQLLSAQSFTYQGMLKQAGVPANGNFDFQFSLWKTASGGSQVGFTLTKENVQVVWGVFSVDLDFGDVWGGNDLYLQIAVRPAGSGSYTTLSPRVKVNRTPYSQFAFSARWSGIVGMPAGFADGVDNDTTYSAGAGLQLVGTTFSVATGGIVTSMLANGAVTTDKIADGAVTSAKLSTTGVSAGTYGSATQVGQFTVDAQGRITSATNVTISGVSPGGSAGGDLSGSYPNPTVARLQGRAVSSTAPAAGQVLKWDGSAWSPANDEAGASLWQQSGSDIFYNLGKVGIGTSSPAYLLHVETSAGEHAIYGLHTSTSGTIYGVYGENKSPNGAGVCGRASGGSGYASGVVGVSYKTQGKGVYGLAYATSGTNYGVYGLSESTFGRGVYGWATATSGTNYGVHGQNNSPNGYGVYSAGRFAATGTKSFQIDHPLSPETHYLNHFCAEGPEPYNLYRGTVVLDARGEAWVQLPDYFEAINRDPSYHLTPIGAPMPNLHVAVEIQNNRFKIAGGVPGKKVSWEVKAVRNDRWVQEYGYQSEQVKPR